MDLYLIAEFSWASPASWLAILKMALGLGTVILVHELGHFLVAKLCGVKCEKFYVGFDFFDIKIGSMVLIPRSLVKFQWGETEYGIGIIPLGGYVKMLGQDDNPANAAQEAERTRIRKESLPGEGAAIAVDARSGEQPEEQAAEENYALDPRSFTAKSVPQRMAIISAGVVMNLIFAVIFATIAYRVGVSYTPSEIGSTVPGAPAWEAGLQPGDRILQVGRSADPSEHLRFVWDLQNAVAMSDDGGAVPLRIRHADGEEEWIEVKPRKNVYEGLDLPSIGISPAETTKLGSPTPVSEHLPAGKASPPFKAGDTIVAVNGQPVADGPQLRKQLARHTDVPVTFTVERQAGEDQPVETLDIVVAPNPVRHLGLQLQMGPITSIHPDSPAAAAGLQPGDVLQRLNGEPIGDPMLLPERLRQLAGEQVTLELLRPSGDKSEADGETIEVTLTPQQPETYHSLVYPTRPMSAESLGIAYQVLNDVVAVEPGSPAAEAGMQPGDQLMEAQFLPTPQEEKEEDDEALEQMKTEIEFGPEKLNWPYVHSLLQGRPLDASLKLTYRRQGKIETVELTPVESQQFHNPHRGIVLTPKSEIHEAETWGDAFALGLRQTKEDALKVATVLKKLASGQLAITNLGGPGTIAVVATSEASAGTSRLLIFLTFLSANLAVLNFLPIPVLDGGHMVFLIAEGIRGKPLDEKWLLRLTIVGFAFVISLMLFVIGLDVVRFAR